MSEKCMCIIVYNCHYLVPASHSVTNKLWNRTFLCSFLCKIVNLRSKSIISKSNLPINCKEWVNQFSTQRIEHLNHDSRSKVLLPFRPNLTIFNFPLDHETTKFRQSALNTISIDEQPYFLLKSSSLITTMKYPHT